MNSHIEEKARPPYRAFSLPGRCAECSREIMDCPCGIWWCAGWIHTANRIGGGSHFCYLGNPELIARAPGGL